MNIANQAIQSIKESIKINTKTAMMKSWQLKTDQFNSGRQVFDMSKAKADRGNKKFRIVSKSSISQLEIKPTSNESGIGVIGGYYILADCDNKIYEGDTFTTDNITYTIGPVNEIKILNTVTGYRATLTVSK